MKKILAAVLCAAIILSLGGCSDKGSGTVSDTAEASLSEEKEGGSAAETKKSSSVNAEDYIGSFPDLESFEKDMNKAFMDMTEGKLSGDWDISKFTLSDAGEDDDVHSEQIFMCQYNIVTLLGKVIDGKVIFVSTMMIQTDLSSYSAEDIIDIIPLLMIPTVLYDDSYEDLLSLLEFERTIVNDGTYDNDIGFEYELDGIEYTVYYSPETNFLGFKINAKELWNEKSTELADALLADGDLDRAMYYYEKADADSEKMQEIYYQKAQNYLNDNDLVNAEKYFELAGKYKDSDVKLLEVYYKNGEKQVESGDYLSAAKSFQKAGSYSDAGEKFRECSFRQGEIYADEKKYSDAISCFEKAGNYGDAESRYKEVNYLYAEQLLLSENTDKAAGCFKKAGDYKDAATRMTSYYYDKGCEYMNGKQYPDAIKAFEQVLGYSDAEDKYKEASYLYGEQLLENGSPSSAEKYFYNAGDYKDASSRVQRYYYETAEAFFSSKQYLSAAGNYSLAGGYSDSAEKLLECYYSYGVSQMDMNYTYEGIKYLSKCRGYKDTDDIIATYYYDDAVKAVSKFMNSLSRDSFERDIDDAYSNAASKLELCGSYKDSGEMLKCVERAYSARMNISQMTDWRFSLSNMKASCSGSKLKIDNERFVSGGNCTLSMTYNADNDTFSADITDMFNQSARESDVRAVISALLVIFTDISDTSDFDAGLKDEDNWTISGEKESFSMNYGGYKISVQTQLKRNYYIDCKINVSK